MKPEIIEALALELAKGVMAQRYIDHPANKDLTSPYLWVKTYLESEKQIEEMANRLNANN